MYRTEEVVKQFWLLRQSEINIHELGTALFCRQESRKDSYIHNSSGGVRSENTERGTATFLVQNN